jgi:6-phosphogluconate dehydrogenase
VARAFLLERLGADRYLDPTLMATILGLRQRLIAESAITTAAETMLAVLSYYETLQVQGWIADLAVRIEHDFFGDDAFTEMARKGHRRADRFAVEDW